MEKEGFGEEFSICSSFCFGEIWGGQKYKFKIKILSRSFLCGFVQSKKLHPRHPPRAFPLGLLAPRCLCAGKARASWGEEVSSPRVGLLLEEITLEKFRPRHPHSTFCKLEYVVSLSLLYFS